MSENSFHLENTFWNMKDQATPFNRMNSAYYQIQLGLSHISSYFSYEPAMEDPARAAFEVQAARASAFMTTGTHQADVLVLIPMEAAWDQYTPQDHKYWPIGPCIVAPYQHESLQILEKAYGETLLRLVDDKLDFDLIDSVGLAECTVEDGRIKTPFEAFRHLVIFDSGYVEPDVQAQIDRFLASGGTVTAVRSVNGSVSCTVWQEKYQDSFRLVSYDEVCKAVLAGNAVRTLEIEGCPSVRVRKSETEDAELWFLHNRAAEHCSVTVKETGTFVKLTPVWENDGEMIESDGEFVLDMSAGSAVMLVREK